MRLRRTRRVRKRPEFQKAQREGRRISTPHFVLIVARSEQASEGVRLGITASRKVGNAVRRNRLKRLVREAFRETEAFLPAGFDLIVICRKDTLELSLPGVVAEWKKERSKIERAARALKNSTRTAGAEP